MPSTNTLRVLIVEDEPTDAAILKRSLQHLEIPALEVFFAATGAEGKRLLASQSFDLLLLDLHLPDVVGYELVQEVKQLRKDLPVIVCTSINSDEAALQVGKIGADDYIVKDDLLGSSLARTIRRLLRHRLESGTSSVAKQRLLEEPSDKIDTWLAWKFPERFVAPGNPPPAILDEARSRYGALLETAMQRGEADLHNAMREFESFAFEKRVSAQALIALHKAWDGSKADQATAARHRYILFEILAALVERYRTLEQNKGSLFS